MRKNKFPKGWNEARVRKVLAHYEKQSEEEAVAEDEAAYEDRTQTAMEIPIQLVPDVRKLIAKHQTLHNLKTSAANKG
jgi:hypothetical protein